MLLKGLSRKETTLLMSIRTVSAFKRSWLTDCAGQIDPTFPAFEVNENMLS